MMQHRGRRRKRLQTVPNEILRGVELAVSGWRLAGESPEFADQMTLRGESQISCDIRQGIGGIDQQIFCQINFSAENVFLQRHAARFSKK